MAEDAKIDMKDELDRNSIILSMLPAYYYTESIGEILKSLKDAKICYVDLNKGTEAMLRNFSSMGIDSKNIFFIDGVTTTINRNAKFENALLLSSPYALTEMGIAISEVIKSGSFDVLIFDSLSTLNVYAKEISGASGKFASHIVNKLRSSKNKGVLTCLEHDADTDLIKQSSLFVDKVVRMNAFRSEPKALHKVATIVSAMLAIGAFSFFYSSSQGITAMAIADENSGAYDTPYVIFALIAVAMASLYLFMIKRKKLKITKAQSGIAERKDKNSIRKEFKGKIYGWLKGIKALGLF